MMIFVSLLQDWANCLLFVFGNQNMVTLANQAENGLTLKLRCVIDVS